MVDTGQAVATPNGVPAEYWQYAQQSARAHGVPLGLLAGLLTQENGWKATGTSPAGAVGIAQLMPGTAAGLGVDPNDPRQAIDGAARYLLEGYRAAGNNWTGALVYYNAGPGGLQTWQAGGQADSSLPAETQRYLPAVQNLAAQFNQWLTTQGSDLATPPDTAASGGFGVPPGTPSLPDPGKAVQGVLDQLGAGVASGVAAATQRGANHLAEFWNQYYPHIFFWLVGIGLLAIGTYGLVTNLGHGKVTAVLATPAKGSK